MLTNSITMIALFYHSLYVNKVEAYIVAGTIVHNIRDYS